MATFSVNQNRHLFVVTDVKNISKSGEALKTHVGSIGYHAPTTVNPDLYFKYQGAGGVTRSDLINKDKIVSITYTTAQKLRRPHTAYKITLDSSVNNGLPISGQDYILRIVFRQCFGNSDADTYIKYGAVHAVASMTSASDFYKVLALSLAKNFSREVTPLVKILLEGGPEVTASDTVTGENPTLNGTYTGVIIEEADQPWVLGTMKKVPVYFDVIPTEVTYNGGEIVWGTVEKHNVDSYDTDGYNLADLEWFSMGERGDQYRGKSYPNVIYTKYLVDPSKEYDTLDIHYYFSDEGINVQRSEKLLTIIAPANTESDETYSKKLLEFAKEIAEKTGKTLAIAKVKDSDLSE